MIAATKMKNRFALYFSSILLIGGVMGIFIELCASPLSSFIAGAGLIWPIALIVSFVLLRRISNVHTSRTSTIINIALALFTMILFPGGIMPPEGKFIFNPDIDTRYAPGYSETKFKQVSIGMTEKDVVSLLGEPFDKGTVDWAEHFNVIWVYSCDGACSWYDFAWKRKQVHFKNGFVVGGGTGWSYD